MTLPESKAWLVDGFCRYTHGMVRRRFYCFGVQYAVPKERLCDPQHSLVVFTNHVGWWDPIVAMLLRRAVFPDRILYAPIDAAALKNYRVFRKMGFFGIEMDRLQGAAEFLKTSREILATNRSSLWVTPEGTFVDCRHHEHPFQPGVAHLAASVRNVSFVPLAIEYPFWEEARPMILVRFGQGIVFEPEQTKQQCAEILHAALRQTQRELADAVMERRADAFEYLIAPKGSNNSWYDTVRAWSAWYHGRSFDPRHSAITRKTQT